MGIQKSKTACVLETTTFTLSRSWPFFFNVFSLKNWFRFFDKISLRNCRVKFDLRTRIVVLKNLSKIFAKVKKLVFKFKKT